MTQQTLREEFNSFLYPKKNTIKLANEKNIADFFLARFKEFAEKELIKENEEHHYLCGKDGECNCGAKHRNALRNEQREILAEKLK